MTLISDIFNFCKKEEIIIPPEPKEDSVEPIIKNMWSDLKPLDLSKIETIQFPEDQYLKEIYPKTQIVLHHTISGDGINGDISTWEADPARVAVCIIVDRAGTPWQLFSSKYWAYHLKAGNADLDKHSIGIEIDNWGWLIPTVDGKYETYYGNKVYTTTQYYPDKFRGYNYYEKYTNAQIQTVGELILYWNKIHNIPLTYRDNFYDMNSDAVAGVPGIWSHTSYRKPSEKQDIHPQPELLDMLKTLSTN